MRLLLLLAAVAGCVDAGLVPCGDLSCPGSYVCLDTPQGEKPHRCVSTDQLKSCGALDEGNDCNVNNVSGKCLDGACTPVICGNGTTDPGEACDDGNQISGDGCSGTCDSVETCGNGKVDVAKGEHCDCGDAEHPSALCDQPNSDDETAECTQDCQPRFCGDGELNTIEQCDGSLPADVSCATFGYYRGTPTCSSFCQVSPSTCEGRCGDGVIDESEFCDGVLPEGGTCTGLGFDLGPSSCGTGCNPVLDKCGLLGWSRAHDVRVAPVDLWGGTGDRIAVAYANGDAYVRSKGSWSQATGVYTQVTGGTSTVWAVGPSDVSRWTVATGWQHITPPWTPDADIRGAWGSDELGLFVSMSASSTLARLNGDTWTTLAGPWTAGATFGHLPSKLWIVSTPDDGPPTTYTYDGTSTLDLELSSWDAFEDGRGHLWIVDGDHAYRPGSSERSVQGQTFAPSPDGMYAGLIDGATGHEYRSVFASQSSPLYYSDLPAPMLMSDGDASLYAGASDGLHVVRDGAWVNAGVLERTSHLLALPGGPLVSSGEQDRSYRELSFQELDPGASGCGVIGQTSESRVIASCAEGLVVDGVVADGSAHATDLWASRDGQQAAMVGWFGGATYGSMGGEMAGAMGGATYGMLASTDGVTWTEAISNVELVGVAGDSLMDLYVTTLAGDLQHFDGTLITIATGVTGSPMVTPTSVYARKGSDLLVYDRATHTTSTLPLPTGTRGITLADDMLFALADDQQRGSPVFSFDGAQWDPVRLPQGVGAIAEITHAGRTVVVREATNVLVNYRTIWFLTRTGSWKH